MANNRTIEIEGVRFTLITGKKAEQLVDDYRHAERRGYHYLWEVYGSCSRRKEQAWEDCYAINQKVGGSFMYIAGYCITNFTLVYLLRHKGHEYIVKETYANRFIAEVPFGALR